MTQNRFDSNGSSAQTTEVFPLQILDLNPQPDTSAGIALTPDPSPPNANSDFSKKILSSEVVLIVVGILINVIWLTLSLVRIDDFSINDIWSFDWFLKTLEQIGVPTLNIIGFCLLGLRHVVKQLRKQTSWIVKNFLVGGSVFGFVVLALELVVYIFKQNQLGLEFDIIFATNKSLLLVNVVVVMQVKKLIGKLGQEQAEVDNVPNRLNEA